METKDLMIDDLVQEWNNDHTETHIVKVEKPIREGVYDKYNIFHDADWIESIPITAEILAKNFKLSGYDRYYVGKDLYVKWYDNDTFGFGKMNDAYNEPQFESFACCNSVHELQHALRLVGLNEVADDLKI